ncbi:hypothetical protein RHGRI_001630 [Rhododendron griersonianum]|uniref:Secreted protein n=1 Tax=Rhododendron griersonianum TaxID=479676 RepID=A0AAV6LLQ9_9ERIC|nr:hypothetical protein RHGRI_001630 [Rhododendron griersonianum]
MYCNSCSALAFCATVQSSISWWQLPLMLLSFFMLQLARQCSEDARSSILLSAVSEAAEWSPIKSSSSQVLILLSSSEEQVLNLLSSQVLRSSLLKLGCCLSSSEDARSSILNGTQSSQVQVKF